MSSIPTQLSEDNELPPEGVLPGLPALPKPFGYLTAPEIPQVDSGGTYATLKFSRQSTATNETAVYTEAQLKAAMDEYGKACAEHARTEAFSSLEPVALLYSGLKDSPRQYIEWASVGETDHWPVDQWVHYKVERLAVIPGAALFDERKPQKKTTSKEVVYGMALSPSSTSG